MIRLFMLFMAIGRISLIPLPVQQIYGSSDSTNWVWTPSPKQKPRINGPLVYGCRPGKPFLYRIPCQGEKPVRFTVKNLPNGLKLDPVKGIISGIAPEAGEYLLLITAENSKGKDRRKLKIIAGDKLALTPPM